MCVSGRVDHPATATATTSPPYVTLATPLPLYTAPLPPLQSGIAGYGGGNDPNLDAFIYDTLSTSEGNRYSYLATTTYPRM